jgi:hypothetical protein
LSQSRFSVYLKTMNKNSPLVRRLVIGKSIGFIIGFIGVVCMAILWPDSSWMDLIGFALWYTTLGAIIGVFGFMTEHPYLKFPMPWWIRSTILGASMNFILTLLLYDKLALMMLELCGEDCVLLSPFWFVLEGALVALIIEFCLFRFVGEGPSLLNVEQ